MRWSYRCHVDSIEHNWDHIEVEHLPELLRDVILAQGVLEGEVELKQVPFLLTHHRATVTL